MIHELAKAFLNTPPLWTKTQFDIAQFEFPTMDVSQIAFEALTLKLRLGHQIEQVFKQLITQSKNYKLLLHNLPISKDKITQGEIDFILRHIESDQLIHVELSYKFYLIDPDISDPVHSLIGPNRRDTFHKKMTKIKERQFPLLHTPEAIQELETFDINHSELIHQCCFKAQLFRPYGGVDINIGAFNADCLGGYWLKYEQFKTYAFAQAEYYMPSKTEWVLPVSVNRSWQTHAQISNELTPSLKDNYAVMLWMKSKKGELQKIFIVWW